MIVLIPWSPFFFSRSRFPSPTHNQQTHRIPSVLPALVFPRPALVSLGGLMLWRVEGVRQDLLQVFVDAQRRSELRG